MVEYVTDPRTGLPAKLKWLPTVAEVREACEKRAEYYVNVKSLEARGYRWIDGVLTRPKQEDAA